MLTNILLVFYMDHDTHISNGSQQKYYFILLLTLNVSMQASDEQEYFFSTGLSCPARQVVNANFIGLK